jgi:predicted ferric reductase
LVIWLGLLAVITIPVVLAANSPLLAWRQPVYVMAGFAGIAGLCLLLVQPLLAAGTLPGLSLAAGKNAHGYCGVVLLGTVVLHVAGLWVTSPPDVVDALLFRSPTPFSAWGVVAMWAVFASAVLALTRRRLRLRWRSWRIAHSLLAAIIVIGTIVHAVLIEGTMEELSKYALCALVFLAAARVLGDPETLTRLRKSRG